MSAVAIEVMKSFETVAEIAERTSSHIDTIEAGVREYGAFPQPHDHEALSRAAGHALRSLRILCSQIERVQKISKST
jgi:hypothetical protein